MASIDDKFSVFNKKEYTITVSTVKTIDIMFTSLQIKFEALHKIVNSTVE